MAREDFLGTALDKEVNVRSHSVSRTEFSTMSHATLEQLRQLLQRKTDAPVFRSSQQVCPEEDWLPREGLSPGNVSEWIAAERGGGAFQLAMRAVQRRLRAESRWLIVDADGDLFPTACEEMGRPLPQTVFVRGVSEAEALWTVEQSLRSRGVDAVCCWFDRLSPLVGRRLKIAAEAGTALCLVLRGPHALREPSHADMRVRVSPLPSPDWQRRRLQLEVLKIRNGFPGRVTQVELDDETGAVRVVSELADPATTHRATGA